MKSKSQAVENVRVRIHSIKNDGTDNTGDAANLSTIIMDPAGNELVGGIDYTEATFVEIGSTAVYECLFPLTAPVKAFTLVDQNNLYTVILITSTADIGSNDKDINIVSQRVWELSTAAAVAAMAADVTAMAVEVARILGLVMENLVEDDIVRDTNGNKTSSTIYIYDSAANATTHDKSTGLIASYDTAAGYTSNLMDLFKSIKA